MSDLCLRSGLPAWMRHNGIWRPVTQRPITADELLAALERLTKNNSVAALIKSGQSDYDFAHEIEESRGVRRRFRGNATPVADGYSTGVKIVFRTIPSMPPALEDLHVEQGILDHAMPSNGLVLVTGVMGSGKSTLLAAILREPGYLDMVRSQLPAEKFLLPQQRELYQAMIQCREQGIECRVMPVPRNLSSSCGTCVRCEGRWLEPQGEAAGDVERIAAWDGRSYTPVYQRTEE